MNVNNVTFCIALSMFCTGIAETSFSIDAVSLSELSQEGLLHTYAGNYQEALDIFQRLLDAGYTNQAKAGIGKVYYAQKNYEEAFKIYKELADANDMVGQFLLGEMYQLGRGEIQQNLQQAFELYTKSSEQGYLYAKFRLGSMYEGGLYVNQDLDKAMRLYAEAWVIDEDFEEAKNALIRTAFLNNPI